VQRRRTLPAAWIAVSALLLAAGCDEPAQVIQPPPESSVNDAQSEDKLIQLLAQAFRKQDCELFVDLYPTLADSVEFSFVPQHYMLDCDSIPPPPETLLVAITINLRRTAASWVERADLYRSRSNPNGLDYSRWRVREAEFYANVLIETQSQTDYRVEGRHNFIVLQDLRRAPGSTRRFLIYRWEDLDPPAGASEVGGGRQSRREAPRSRPFDVSPTKVAEVPACLD